jgi:SAM-dependent methyltransferase
VNRALRSARFYLDLFGIDPRRGFLAIRHLLRFLGDLRAYRRQSGSDTRFPLRLSALYPCLTEFQDSAGVASGHYFHQDLLVARKIFARRPPRHVDIGSRIDGFVAHLLTFMPVELVDLRRVTGTVDGLTLIRVDATELRGFADDSLDSVSSLHAAEHFGLGRYGDPVDPAACFRFMRALARVLAPAGRLYFSVPVGRERVEFNAHRIFSPLSVLEAFAELRLLSFSAVLDDAQLYPDIAPEEAAVAECACGIFEFSKDAPHGADEAVGGA